VRHPWTPKREKSSAACAASRHVKGIEKMVDENQYCVDVMRQVMAAQAAMAKLNELILENHLNTCVIEAVRGDDPQARERVLEEISDVFEMSKSDQHQVARHITVPCPSSQPVKQNRGVKWKPNVSPLHCGHCTASFSVRSG
jgi:DNA-binding FrmR family transcriptional regulator